jgi:hypothetical protein
MSKQDDLYPRLQIRVSKEHKEIFYKLGGPKWLRKELEKQIAISTNKPSISAPK